MADVAVAERTLPHNLEAERSVLGSILLHNEAFNLAAEVIDSTDFYRDAHRRIFDKMVKLAEPIKKLGEFDIPLKLHREVVATVKLKVVAEGASIK